MNDVRFFLLILIISILFSGCAPDTAPDDATAYSEYTLQTIPPTETIPETTAPPVTEPPAPDEIEILLRCMTTEEKVGQLFLARCPSENAAPDAEAYHLGGYILFGPDFQEETSESIGQKLESYQAAAEIPLLIAVDEEGGSVTRVSRYEAFREKRFSSPRNLYASGGLDAVLEAEKEKCELLGDLGINVNMAPVCDVTTDSDAFMYRRSLGLSPDETGSVISAMAEVMAENGIGSVLKHFPGYGNNTDTHTAMALDSRSLEELESADLIPFAAGIKAGCRAILVSHTIVEALDAEMPASLSPEVHRYLREEMGFDGVIVTDDLIMQAITDAYGPGEAAVLAVLAGNDLLCSSEYPVQYDAVLAAVTDGRISQELLDNAVRRVLKWKQYLNLI